MLTRRSLVSSLPLLAASPGLARAQQQTPRRRIAYLHSLPIQGGPTLTLAILRKQWQRLGYVEGETVLIRSAEGDPSRLPRLVEDLSAMGVAAIIAVGAEAVRSAAATTRTTPIVAIDLETNPIRAGLAASYARPGGNVTGLFLDQPSLAGKWIDLLREAAPRVRTVGVLWDPSTGRDQLTEVIDRARDLSMATEVVNWREPGAVRAAFPKFPPGTSGVITLTGPGFSNAAQDVGQAALAAGLPVITFLKPYLVGGILMSYGPDNAAHFGRAMLFVERILAGASPADLPLEVPSRFEFAIDMRTVKSLGLALPATMLAQADDLIE